MSLPVTLSPAQLNLPPGGLSALGKLQRRVASLEDAPVPPLSALRAALASAQDCPDALLTCLAWLAQLDGEGAQQLLDGYQSPPSAVALCWAARAWRAERGAPRAIARAA